MATVKRLILCCDGTWLDSQSSLMQGKLPIPSNVTRISQAIKSVSSNGIPQIVFYQAGVGSRGGILNRVVGGATAQGLSENIRSGYSFLANNYTQGDEIFLFGFSRGAFTVRSIAGLIGGVGLLTKDGLPYLAEVFSDWLHRLDPGYVAANPNLPFPNKPSASDPRYKKLLRKNHLSRLDVPIKVVGVWDTVGSLGIPRIGWLETLRLQTRSTREYLFYDTKLNDNIVNAFQALALDEHRAAFSPAVWEKPPGNDTNLRQVWFPGVHSNIGGGYADQGQANITLAWMMAQVQSFIDFKPDYILDQYDMTLDHYENTEQNPRPWSFGKIYRSFTGIYILGGRTTRTPGDYFVIDSHTILETSTPLRETMEYVHPSVRTRKLKRGPGVEDEGTYDAHPMEKYKLRPPTGERRPAVWEPRRRKDGMVLHESPLWGIERELLREDPRMSNYLLGNQHGPQAPSGRKSVSPIANGKMREDR
ncbi:MAG: hypothetical protein Q9163_003200 [Psora crenata]